MGGDFWGDQARTGAFSSGYTDPEEERLELEALDVALDWLRSESRTSVGPSCVEVGCHVGFTTRRLHEAVQSSRYTALDINTTAIESARRFACEYGHTAVSFVVASATEIPVRSSSCDVCFSVRCLQNVRAEGGQAKAVDEIHRVLRPGGWLLLIENWQAARDRLNRLRAAADLEPLSAPGHCRFLGPEVRDLLEQRFDEISETHFAAAYYLGTRFAKWLDPEARVEDCADPYNQFFAARDQAAYELHLGPSLMLMRRP